MLSIDAVVLGATTYKEIKEARKEQQKWRQDEEKISVAIRGGVNKSNWRQENQLRQHEEQAILEWLTTIDYAPQQSDFISRRQTGTGQWLLDSTEFQLWLTTEKQTLFCPGIPGSGKTILTSIVIDKLITQFRNDKNIGIAYLYCNFRRRDEQKIDDLLAGLLKQLAQALDPLPDFLKSLYDKHKHNRTRPTLDEILQALESVATLYTKVFIIVDALDECLATGSHRSKFLSGIFDFQEKSGSNLFMTSRHIPEITERFRGHTSLEIRELESDVRRYLDEHISNLPSFVERSPDLQEEVKTGIVDAVDGMFLLAQLHLDSLSGKSSPKAVRTALKLLPSGSNAYDDAYKDAMLRIEGQLLDKKDLAWQILSWITCAKKPLATSELQHALAIELGESSLDENNIPQIEDMVSVCAGLVTVDEESEIIRLVHYTTQETTGRLKSGYGQTNFTTTPHITGATTLAKLLHLSQKSTTSSKKNAQVQASIQALLVESEQYSQIYPRKMTGLHLAAYFGVEKTVQHLLGINIPNEKDEDGRTPLSWAAQNGHEAVVKLLLVNNAEVNLKDTLYGQTPLSWAAESGHEAVVKLLLVNGAEIDSKDISGRTPLSLAANTGQEAVLKLLIEKGADVNLENIYNRAPLSYVAENGHEAILKLLLADNADVNLRDTWLSRTPLMWATANGHEAVVKLLLGNNAEVDVEDNSGRTALSHAVITGHEAIVKLLLAYNAKVNLEDNNGRTPLVVSFKIDLTPLSLAALKEDEGVVKLLQRHKK
ncbi:hypothetical protein V500_04517 [Pseudogymnoascus sp. VKM F-4518 (FW-2643)]|nr:hypothetical protein V500_04517 [Pseudogymnoascus sp. VKM F-4518 (FW-2643)]